MADSKWVSGLDPSMTVAEAARRALTVRLDTLRSLIPACASVTTPDVESVHQLRVATRRAAAVAQQFEPTIPPKAGRRLRRVLRELRRAAGRARDWDVFLGWLEDSLDLDTDPGQAGQALILGYAMGQRSAAQDSLIETVRHMDLAKLDDLWDDVVARVRDPDATIGDGTLADLAKNTVTVQLESFETVLEGGAPDPEALHEIRIEGKRLRYSLEAFDCCFKRKHRREWYPQVVRLQDTLGASNDATVALDHIRELALALKKHKASHWHRARPSLDVLARERRREVLARKREFDVWLDGWRSFREDHSVAGLFARGD